MASGQAIAGRGGRGCLAAWGSCCRCRLCEGEEEPLSTGPGRERLAVGLGTLDRVWRSCPTAKTFRPGQASLEAARWLSPRFNSRAGSGPASLIDLIRSLAVEADLDRPGFRRRGIPRAPYLASCRTRGRPLATTPAWKAQDASSWRHGNPTSYSSFPLPLWVVVCVLILLSDQVADLDGCVSRDEARRTAL